MRSTRLSITATLAVVALATLPGAALARQVFAFGDSITFGLGDTDVECEDDSTAAGYPPRVRSLLAGLGLQNVEVPNRGLCGETALEGVTRIEEVLDEADPRDVVVIMEGTNDISFGFSIESIVFSNAEMARKALEVDVIPVHASVVPRGPDTPVSAQQRTAFFASEMADLAEDTELPFADAYTALVNVPDLFEDFYVEDQFHPNPDGYDELSPVFVLPILDAIQLADNPTEPCTPSPTVLCVDLEPGDRRFEITVEYDSTLAGVSGDGQVTPLDVVGLPKGGIISFTDDQNPEMLVKVLNGCGINGRIWVFYAATTNLGFELRVEDTAERDVRFYRNSDGQDAIPRTDTDAFANCP